MYISKYITRNRLYVIILVMILLCSYGCANSSDNSGINFVKSYGTVYYTKDDNAKLSVALITFGDDKWKEAPLSVMFNDDNFVINNASLAESLSVGGYELCYLNLDFELKSDEECVLTSITINNKYGGDIGKIKIIPVEERNLSGDLSLDDYTAAAAGTDMPDFDINVSNKSNSDIEIISFEA